MRIILATFVLCLTIVGTPVRADYIEWRFDFGPTFVRPDTPIDGYAVVGFDDQNYLNDPLVREDIVLVNWSISYFFVEVNGESFIGTPDPLTPHLGAVQVGQTPNGEWLAIGANLGNGGLINWSINGVLGELYPYYGFVDVPTPIGLLPGYQQMVMEDQHGQTYRVGDIIRWSTVPEPSTLALLGIGLAGMGLARRREKA